MVSIVGTNDKCYNINFCMENDCSGNMNKNLSFIVTYRVRETQNSPVHALTHSLTHTRMHAHPHAHTQTQTCTIKH